MKKIRTKLSAALLIITMLFPVVAQPLSVAALDSATAMQTADAPVLTSAGAAIGTAVGKYLLGRVYQEVSSYAISNDVPIIGGLAKLMLNPSQRAAMKERAQIEQILTTVTDMQQSISKIQAQLDQISDQLRDIKNDINELKAQVNLVQWQVAALEKKIDQQNAIETLNTAAQNMNRISNRYTEAAWPAYKTLNIKSEKLAEKNIERSHTTDPDEIAKLDAEINELQTEVGDALDAFINIFSEGGGMQFAIDIGDLEALIYNADNPTSSYLGAYEAYLRLTTPFEHQITDKMTEAMQSCTGILYQIFIMYSEYCTYMRDYTDEQNAGNPSATNPYARYTDTYFKNTHSSLMAYIDDMALTSGVMGYMVETPLAADKVDEYKSLDPDFKAPECIDTTVSINGVTYQCYKVRSNSDYQYYIILKQLLSKDQIVQTPSLSYFSSSNVTLCRPTLVLDHEYTDDGRYKMISSGDLPGFIEDAYIAVLSYLRLDGGLLELSQNAEHIILHDSSCAGASGGNVIWNVSALDASAVGLSGTVNLKTDNIKNGKTGSKAIAIYRMVETSDKYKNQTYQVLDKAEIQNNTIIVDEGQTLDLTKLTVDVNNITVNIIGDGKIVSNPKITLKNSEITVIGAASQVTFENLNITAKKGKTAAISVKCGKATINFKGTNNISGTATGSNSDVDHYVNYVPGMPIGASHGIYAAKETTFNISGTTKFTGADGGAGICAAGVINIAGDKTAKLIANGSASSLKNSSYFPIAVGAGIGTSVSVSIEARTVTYTKSGSSTQSTATYYKQRSGKSVDSVGSSAVINITGITVEATGADISNINASASNAKIPSSTVSSSEIKNIAFSSDDIGGASAIGTGYDIKSGTLKSVTIKASRQKISSKIASKDNDNSFMPDVYTLTTYTHGKNGVTKGGVLFKLHGSKGSSDWIAASSCGNSKDTWTGTFVINSVGKLTSVEFKTKNNNDWFPGEIKISAKYGGESMTVYGGRSINTNAVTLKPNDVVYKVRIKTGSVKDSGTNSDIHLVLRDSRGVNSDKYQLDSIHYKSDAFEKKDDVTFWLKAPDGFGECVGVYLSSDHSGVGPDWKMDVISVERVSGPTIKKGDSFTVSAGYWFRIAQTVYFGKYSGGTGAFYIEVKTSNVKKAGTDSNIVLQVNGSNTVTRGINIGSMADDGNNFERGDLDTMCIGYDSTGIGYISSLTITKDNHGPGADWHLEYIKIKEIIADGKTANAYKFTWNKWIKKETVRLTNRQTLNGRQSIVKLDREVLSGLTANSDGSYTLTVDREITLSESVFELLSEKSAVLNVIMENDDKSIYEVSFDGSAFDSASSVTLGKSYSFTDGRSLFDFLQDVELPAKTKIRLHTENIGFLGNNQYSIFAKDGDGNWNKVENVIDSDGIIEFYAQNVSGLMLVDKTNAWTVLPNIEDWVSGEQASVIEGEALYGGYSVSYSGIADDGAKYISNEMPSKAGKYTAVFTVEATDTYDGLTYEVDFEITPAASVPDDNPSSGNTNNGDTGNEGTETSNNGTDTSIEPTETSPEDTSKATGIDTSAQPSDKSMTSSDSSVWIWIVVAVVAFGAGFAICLLTVRKKSNK